MSTALLAAVAVILCILFRILNVNSQPHRPTLHCKDKTMLETILKIAPLLQEPYMPTRLWGFSGHVQTIIHSIIGRVRCPWPIGERCYLELPDGTTLTFDLYEPLDSSHEDDITLAICPGIGNTSESVYIRTFVHYAQCHGYRCAVLNHVGALASVRVTAPRIFTYGHTGDFSAMIDYILERHNNTQIVCIGFSLGGNIVTKYLGEPENKPPPNIVGGISICQGYCAIQSTKWLLNWQNFRRFYLYVMTESMKTIILRHRHALLNDEAKQKFNLNEHEIISAATLPELDEAYTRKVHNFGTVRELYQWSSCINYLKHISVPMIFINAKDDPLVPDALLEPIRDFALNSINVMYLELAHGGHLGFYEGGLVYPNPVTWLDRTLVSLVGSLALLYSDSQLKKTDTLMKNIFDLTSDDSDIALDASEIFSSKSVTPLVSDTPEVLPAPKVSAIFCVSDCLSEPEIPLVSVDSKVLMVSNVTDFSDTPDLPDLSEISDLYDIRELSSIPNLSDLPTVADVSEVSNILPNASNIPGMTIENLIAEDILLQSESEEIASLIYQSEVESKMPIREDIEQSMLVSVGAIPTSEVPDNETPSTSKVSYKGESNIPDYCLNALFVSGALKENGQNLPNLRLRPVTANKDKENPDIKRKDSLSSL